MLSQNRYIEEYLGNYDKYTDFDEFLKIKKKENNEKFKKDLIDMLNPPDLTFKEKLYYWTAFIVDIPLKFSILSSVVSGGDPDWLRATGISAALYFGSTFLLKSSYNHRNPEKPISLEFNPNIDFGGKKYSLFKKS